MEIGSQISLFAQDTLRKIKEKATKNAYVLHIPQYFGGGSRGT